MSDIIERLTELSDLMMNDRPYNDSDFTDIDEAIDNIEHTVVPAPSALALLAVAGIIEKRRR